MTGQATTSLATYVAVAVLVFGVTGARAAVHRIRFYRRERRAERERWANAQPHLDLALAAKRAEPVKEPKPALPRPVGMPVQAGASR